MNAWQFMMDLHKVCSFQSRERQGKASHSEIRRWITAGSVRFNGETITWDEPIDFPVFGCVVNNVRLK